MANQRYTAPAIALHWLVALGMLGAFVVGVYMHDLPLSPWKLKIYSYHKWVGVTVFLLALIRILWRLGHRPPALPLAMPAWQRVAAEGMHHLLYLLMFAIPLTGWLMSSAKGFQTVYLGLLPLPDLLAKNPTLGGQLKEVHEALNFLMIALVAGHAGAAIKHHLMDKDDVLTRMLPFHK